jgi:hypothetical protein
MYVRNTCPYRKRYVAMARWLGLCLTALCLTPALLHAQTTTNVAALAALADDAHRQESADREAAEALARRFGLPIRQTLPDGREIELKGLENGRPVYRATFNLNAAISVSTDKVWPGGSAMLGLTGANVRLGVWDGGTVAFGHQELIGRVQPSDGISFPFSDHATHVAGTMIATGVDPPARGMASSARIISYDWNSDTSEMSSAAANGLRVSNHSYGFITGWSFGNFGPGTGWYWFGVPAVSSNEDYLFGFYSDEARAWDQIAFNAPRYLICKSAGNDRGQGPAPGTVHWVWTSSGWAVSTAVRQVDGGADGFDCISHAGISKNILTVGAVADVNGGYAGPGSVVMSSFSSWGPADDGRIKPDIVGNGVGLHSSVGTADNAYSSFSGTSMSSPNVAGSLGLLIEHFRTTRGLPSSDNDGDMRAATLKALVIHTADECGPAPGPDYIFGWGLLNTARAAEVISTSAQNPSMMIESTLTNGSTFSEEVSVVDSNAPLKATLCWTDPAATVPSASLNSRTANLVRDLDLRIIGPSGTYLPWKLNPDAPSDPAMTGDNVKDNVEQILVEEPEVGLYTIRVSHKGTIPGGGQAFSLIITGGCRMPEFTSTPADQTVCIGGSATLNVAAQGFNPSYQWKRNGEPVGEDAPSLSLENLTLDDDGAVFTCTVTTPCGEITTPEMTLSVQAPPAIIEHPSDRIDCEAGSVMLSVDATGSDLQYQWFKNGATIPNATGPALDLSPFSAAKAGTYNVRVSNAACGHVNSESVTLHDCDNDGWEDACQIDASLADDCNENLIPDTCEQQPTVSVGPDLSLCLNAGGVRLPAPQFSNVTPPMTLHWAVVSGPSFEGLDNPVATRPMFTPPLAGDYVIEVALTDGLFPTCPVRDQMHVSVTPPMVIDAGPPVWTCVGMESDPLGGEPLMVGGTPPYQIRWFAVTGRELVEIIDRTAAHPKVIAHSADDYRLRVVVRDSSQTACEASADTMVFVSAFHLNLLTSRTAAVDELITLAGASLVFGGEPPYVYAWQFLANPGGQGALESTDGPMATFRGAAPGTYIVRVTVTDSLGCQAIAQVSIHVQSSTPAPTPTPAPSQTPSLPDFLLPINIPCAMGVAPLTGLLLVAMVCWKVRRRPTVGRRNHTSR